MDDPFDDDTMFDAAEELLVEGMLRVEQVMRELRARGYDRARSTATRRSRSPAKR